MLHVLVAALAGPGRVEPLDAPPTVVTALFRTRVMVRVRMLAMTFEVLRAV